MNAILEQPPRVEPEPNPEADAFFEIVDGQKVWSEPISLLSMILANQLLGHLKIFCKGKNLGIPVLEVMFRLNLPKDRKRRPDIAFVSFEKWPANKPFAYRDEA